MVLDTMTLNELQELVQKLYGNRDAARGLDATIDALDNRIHGFSSLAEKEIDDRAKTLARVMVEVTSIASQTSMPSRYAIARFPSSGVAPPLLQRATVDLPELPSATPKTAPLA